MGRKLGIYDIIAIIFVVLAAGWLLFVITRLFGPTVAEGQTVIVPSPIVLPTFTPTRTPLPTLPPTFTDTPTLTIAPTTTPTLTPTLAPSATITASPSITVTATITPTPTPPPSATPGGPGAASPSPFPYELPGGQVVLVPNTYNAAACAWQGLGGQVFGLQGTEINISSGLQAHVFGSGIDLRSPVGSNSNYGQSGWEIAVATSINTNTYFVQLETAQGTAVSDIYSVTFPGDCQRNVALLRFRQTREA